MSLKPAAGAGQEDSVTLEQMDRDMEYALLPTQETRKKSRRHTGKKEQTKAVPFSSSRDARQQRPSNTFCISKVRPVALHCTSIRMTERLTYLVSFTAPTRQTL